MRGEFPGISQSHCLLIWYYAVLKWRTRLYFNTSWSCEDCYLSVVLKTSSFVWGKKKTLIKSCWCHQSLSCWQQHDYDREIAIQSLGCVWSRLQVKQMCFWVCALCVADCKLVITVNLLLWVLIYTVIPSCKRQVNQTGETDPMWTMGPGRTCVGQAVTAGMFGGRLRWQTTEVLWCSFSVSLVCVLWPEEPGPGSGCLCLGVCSWPQLTRPASA